MRELRRTLRVWLKWDDDLRHAVSWGWRLGVILALAYCWVIKPITYALWGF